MRFQFSRNKIHRMTLGFLVLCCLPELKIMAQTNGPFMNYSVGASFTVTHQLHIQLQTGGWSQDTINFKMPRWTPGYYQIMGYADGVENIVAKDNLNRTLPLKKLNDNTWTIIGVRNKAFNLSYDVKAEKRFVAQSYLDSAHAYLVPAGVFLYADGYLHNAVTIKIELNKKWDIATGLEPLKGKPNEFVAPDFDVLYDCPILAGKLEELPAFFVHGVEHRFLGYQIGNFDRVLFMQNLKKIVEASVTLIGDVPYHSYTFIGIGPGRGGIEHLNNTTVSFNGNDLHIPESMNRMMNFLAHEYFHHYNVKRIRPFELGPFDYDQGSKTNLLWVSEGLSVYYEYLMVKRAGLVTDQTLYSDFEKNIEATENNPGRLYQSLAQASYKTWSNGPFGTQGEEAGKSISYYDKGPVVGLLLDFAIRHATQNRKSLDDVMRLLYWKYYKELQRGFTDAEFEQSCETVAGISLASFFDYVYTTKEIDYNTYLGYAGLKLESNDNGKAKKFAIRRFDKMDELQAAILKSWLGGL
jgi:predicted metalloprotease with PDZ domain